jgi:hypothetical protein
MKWFFIGLAAVFFACIYWAIRDRDLAKLFVGLGIVVLGLCGFIVWAFLTNDYSK